MKMPRLGLAKVDFISPRLARGEEIKSETAAIS
ncbi:Uncharacterised protein [uncultured archaeon]|nr:Uncharacterised protein [uncultured archaeon]